VHLSGFLILAAEYTAVSGFEFIIVDRSNLIFFLMDVIIANSFGLCSFQPFGKGILQLFVVIFIRQIYPLRAILKLRINFMVQTLYSVLNSIL